MKAPATIALACIVSCTPAVHAACNQGAYASGGGDYVVVVPLPDPNAMGQRYLFRDGRRGSTADAGAPLTCAADSVTIKKSDGSEERWAQLAFTITDTRFSSVETQLAGRLIEPSGTAAGGRPLVVMVHGSERTSALSSPYAYSLAAQGIAVFVYDKRGTGASEGDYTQNFELLAADAASAFAHAKSMTRGRVSKAGYFGGSQGGWVAPLAATRSDAQFVAIGFGLVASPIEEDREQMISEARALGLDNSALALINRLSAATSRLVLSGFSQGYDELAQVRRELAQQPWSQRISGEYSGAIVRLTDDELRRVGRARFDNVELIWDYDSVAALRRVNVPRAMGARGRGPRSTDRNDARGVAAAEEGRQADRHLSVSEHRSRHDGVRHERRRCTHRHTNHRRLPASARRLDQRASRRSLRSSAEARLRDRRTPVTAA